MRFAMSQLWALHRSESAPHVLTWIAPVLTIAAEALFRCFDLIKRRIVINYILTRIHLLTCSRIVSAVTTILTFIHHL